MRSDATWCLKQESWPDADRTAWRHALRGDDWLDDVGPAHHWRQKTREKYGASYGHWLAWLEDEGELRAQPPSSRATRERLHRYARWMRDRVAPVTVRMRLEDLKAVLDAIDPRPDPAPFRDLLARLPRTPSRDKRRQLRDPADLIELGRSLMRRAEVGEFGPPRYNAVAFRDGLLIALAAWRPLRRGNLATLRIGEHVKRIDGELRIVIARDETKAGVAIDMPWPKSLLPEFERYVGRWRGMLLGGRPDPDFLWISRRGGGQVSAHTIACNFRRHTKAAFGVAISPHRFRDAAATMMAIRDPANVRAAAAVLGHRSYDATQKHYNLARQLDATAQLHGAVDALIHDEETNP